ncbi:hypothetical protein ACH5RR_010857 [Cinchona calisaya]|uniref:DELLA protein RGL1 n=1 Tax=Cinchona calisaya TaxID=153742 RepID=A0ABD3AK38_9GENT
MEDHSLYKVYGEIEVEDPWNPTDYEVMNFFGGTGTDSQQNNLPQEECNWVQNDISIPHVVTPALESILQPIIYDHMIHYPKAHQQQLPEETAKPQLKENQHSFSLASLELLGNSGKWLIKKRDHEILSQTNDQSGQKLSLAEIVRVAGKRYIQFSTQKADGFSELINPYGTYIITDLLAAETAGVELVQLLLIVAECVGQRQFDLASELINCCLWLASDSGNSAQRIVFYFAQALQNRINVETGKTTPEKMMEQYYYAKNLEVDFDLSFLACHQALPFIQVTQFAAMQAIFDNLKSANKIHLIDLHIRSGIHWTVLMQALTERDEHDRPAVLLKITAVGLTNKQHVEETGKRLISFAESLNLSLSFKVIMVSDMQELKEDMFNKEADEAVAVYCPLILRTMISKPDSLRTVIKVIRRMKPSVVVVTEVEANHNSPSFLNRFTESLFFYSGFFDSLDECMERNNMHRKTIEGIYLGEGIRNMVGSEGDKRCTRNVRIDVWREFFARYGMEEVELSNSSLRQANLILNYFHNATSCNITSNGKGITVGWKGTPIHSLTTWKFL